ncbi:MAG: hypothetical protein ACM3XM_16445 [Mycobacterium leprae]
MRLLLRLKQRSGYVLITVLLALAVICLIGVAVLNSSTSALRLAAQITADERALDAANAGIEWSLAYFQTHYMLPSTPPAPVTIPMGNYSATDTLTVGTDTQGNPTVTSVGTSGSSSRTINAALGNGVPGAYRSAIYSTSPSNAASELNQNVNICGDVFSNNNLTLNNGVHIYAGSDPACAAYPSSAKGVAIAVKSVLFQNRSQVYIEGGYCDANNIGPACNNQKPTAYNIPAPDFGATGVYYITAQAQNHFYPTDRTLSVASGDQQIYYVNGNLTLTGGTVNGRITYAATGTITVTNSILNNSACNTTTHPCSLLLVSQGNINLSGSANGQTIYAAIITEDALNTNSNWSIHGSVSASTLNFKNNTWLYTDDPYYNFPPPGLPGAPTGTGPGLLSWSEGP